MALRRVLLAVLLAANVYAATAASAWHLVFALIGTAAAAFLIAREYVSSRR